jgi:hypothetical protein
MTHTVPFPCRSHPLYIETRYPPKASKLKRGPVKTALQPRSICWFITAFRGLRCHPLTCISLKLRLTVDSNPT